MSDLSLNKTIAASSGGTSWGIAGIVATLDEESVLEFIAATMMSFVGTGRIIFVLTFTIAW